MEEAARELRRAVASPHSTGELVRILAGYLGGLVGCPIGTRHEDRSKIMNSSAFSSGAAAFAIRRPAELGQIERALHEKPRVKAVIPTSTHQIHDPSRFLSSPRGIGNRRQTAG